MIQTGIAIIGSGFGGVGMAIRLQQAGFHDFVILEKEGDVGGCWRDNTYPGAACDVPSHLYSYSFEPKFDWSRKFAPQREIHAYIRHCADKYGIRPKIRFHTEVSGARFDEARARWIVATTTGETVEARILISACGQLNRPSYPRLKGLESFQGDTFHSARWNHEVNLKGKRVAVVGTGASAIQFVPELVKEVGALTLFQRSAPYVIPKPDRGYTRAEQAVYARLPRLQELSRTGLYWQHEARAFAFGPLKKLMKVFEYDFHRHLNASVSDPALRKKLTPDYPLGCKRILISNEYYEALAKPTVQVVNEGIDAVTETGIRTKDGRAHPVDAIIFGTGFQATDFLAPMKIAGRGGLDLNQAWKDGAEAYLGISVHGFPNLFILYGPNTNLGHNSILFMLESQFDYIEQCLKAMQVRQLATLDVKAAVQGKYNRWVQDQIKRTVWEDGCTSWYKNEAGKNTNNWPGFTLVYKQRTHALRLGDYELVGEGQVTRAA